MSSAVLRIQVATLSDAVDGQGRIDGVPNQLVTVTSLGAGNVHTLRFWDVANPLQADPLTPAVPAITRLGPQQWSFLPPGGASGWGQTFGLELNVDLGTDSAAQSRHIYAIPTQNAGIVFPLFGEGADRQAALYAVGAVQIGNSADNAGGNWRGSAPRQIRALAREERFGGVSVAPAVQSNPGTNTTAVLVGSRVLPACSLVALQAVLGDAAGTHSASVELRPIGSSAVATLTVTQTRGSAENRPGTPVALTAGAYDLFVYGAASGTWQCSGIVLQVR